MAISILLGGAILALLVFGLAALAKFTKGRRLADEANGILAILSGCANTSSPNRARWRHSDDLKSVA